LLIPSFLALTAVWYTRFCQAEPAPVVGTTKCPESLCLSWELPSSGRRVRLLRGHYSPFLAPTDSFANPLWLSPTSAFRLVRGVCAGCYQPLLPPGPSRRYLCESFLGCLSPYPGGLLSALCLVLPQPSSAFPIIRLGRLPACLREYDFPRVGFRGCSYFVLFKPPSSLASQIVPTAASFLAGQPRLFTSEQNVCRCLHTHRTCYPPDYRQLAERGLSPRKIRSLVGCSRMMPTFPPSPYR
jgi:hypothetical protein